MTRIVLDPIMQSKLCHLSQPLELCDESGKVLAHVVPISSSIPPGKKWEPDFDEEDLARQEKANEKRFSTAEMLAYLEQL
jgi:hypothetical protein